MIPAEYMFYLFLLFLCSPRRTCTAVFPSLGVLLAELPGWLPSREAVSNRRNGLFYPINSLLKRPGGGGAHPKMPPVNSGTRPRISTCFLLHLVDGGDAFTHHPLLYLVAVEVDAIPSAVVRDSPACDKQSQILDRVACQHGGILDVQHILGRKCRQCFKPVKTLCYVLQRNHSGSILRR